MSRFSFVQLQLVPIPLRIAFLSCLIFGCVVETPPESQGKVTERLIPLLLHASQPDMRRTAALSLGKIGDPQGIPALVSSLSDEDEEVRQWSVWALGTMADALPEQALIALIQRLTDSSPLVKQTAVSALGQTSTPEELMRVLEEAYSISTPATQQAIIQTLSHFEFPFSYALFLKALQSQDPQMRQIAVAGLGELGDPRGLLVMRTHLLQDSSVGVRSEAAFRLGKLGGSGDVPALRRAMETDPAPNVNFWASWALAQIHDNT